jgi:hypothetical protein
MKYVIPKKIKFIPIKYSLFYLCGTFFIVLTSDFAKNINNISEEFLFLFIAFSLFYLGYWMGVSTKKKLFYSDEIITYKFSYAKKIIFIGSIYMIVWGVNQISDFGGSSVSDVLFNIMNPGASYKSKFDIYDIRAETAAVNNITQVLLLFGYIYAVFVITFIYYWRYLGLLSKLFAMFAIFVYILSFLYIGTQKGIGDVLLFFLVGMSILICSDRNFDKDLIKKIKFYTYLILAFVFIYMGVNQSSRADEFGLSESFMFGDVSQSWVANLFGANFALGFFNILGYPSHGYAGLAHNLNQDFVFSNGAGFSQAFESYRFQFFGGSSNFLLTYPARTELATGWPAGMYWATAFPWLASDLTFVGTAFFMFLIGFIFARAWIACITKQDILYFAIFGQLAIFIGYLPANNQVLMSRQGFWIVISILAIWILRILSKRSKGNC